MIDKELEFPFYAKASIFFVGILAFIALLYIAQHILVPIVFALIIAILLHPVVNFFVRRKINRVLAIVLTLLLTFFVIVSFVALIYTQVNRFADSWPILVEKFTTDLKQIITWAATYFDINPENIREWITKTKGELLNNSSAAIGRTLITVGSAAMVLVLVPVYIFMILFYHPILIDFIHKFFASSDQNQVSEIVTQIKTVIQRYLVGLVIEATIIATLYAATLLFLGIDYAILLGIIGALINVIPYVGGFVGVALPMMVALATKSSGWFAIYVLIIFYIIQFIDNHYIIPKIVASKVKINALFSIIVVLVGNALWGVSGMFLAIPLLGIVKLIFDHIKPLKPWGLLLGDTMPPITIIAPILKKIEPILKKIKKKSA